MATRLLKTYRHKKFNIEKNRDSQGKIFYYVPGVSSTHYKTLTLAKAEIDRKVKRFIGGRTIRRKARK